MPQFLLRPEALKTPDGAAARPVQGSTFHLTGPEAFHVAKVLRYREGQELRLFDGHGGRYTGTISRLHSDGSVEGVITGAAEAAPLRGRAQVHLYQGLLKGSHWDWLLEKGTELGVASFTPVLTPRTVVLLREADRAKGKQERWQKLLLAAAKQSQRASLPELREPMRFPEALRDAKERGLVVLAWERMAGSSARESLREALAAAAPGKDLSVSVFVGPEGGFSDEEIELAESLDAVLFGLGPNTLRAETAAIAAASLVLYELGGL